MSKKEKVCAVFVAFNPEISIFKKALKSLENQVEKLLIVDNSPDVKLKSVLQGFTEFEYISPGKNTGLGAAHNTGIDYAVKNDFSHVLLMDQDSIADENMVNELLNVESLLIDKNIKTAAIGPKIVDVKADSGSLCKHTPVFSFKDHIISSGSLIGLENLGILGKMDESYFIDCVDVEWGMRSLKKGYRSVVANRAVLNHDLGEKIVGLSNGNKLSMVIHSPVRYYYQYRNIIRIYRSPNVTVKWILKDLVPYRLSRIFLLPFFSNDKKKSIKMIFKGILHGFLDVKGEYKVQ